MDTAHLEKLRRFALAVALVLITYVTASVTLEADAHVSLLGTAFRVARPELLPVGLAIASLCAALRFYYYGMMLGMSPYSRRRDLLDSLTVHPDEYMQPKPPRTGLFAGGNEVRMYWGPRKFSLPQMLSSWRESHERAAALEITFPRFARARVKARVIPDDYTDDEGEPRRAYDIEVVFPHRCRVASLFEDIDYSAPVWLNLGALAAYGWTFA